jgi:hypothetical protein
VLVVVDSRHKAMPTEAAVKHVLEARAQLAMG